MSAFCSASATLVTILLVHLCVTFSLPSKHAIRQSGVVPDFVTKYAPVVWLASADRYNPSDIGAQLSHTKPEKEFRAVDGAPNPLTLENLDQLNNFDPSNIYLTSVDDVIANPTWLFGVSPDGSGKTEGAISSTIIVNDHGSGLVDAFYMYFFAFNFGGIYFNQEVGSHVGDWEHTMIRFQDGQPQAVWFSQHSFGEAFTYNAVEKLGNRPVVYSANGTHANYGSAGEHTHDGFLRDTTDQGRLWSPVLSAYFYSYDAQTKSFAAYDGSNSYTWLNYIGRWGDKRYADSDPRQHEILGIDATARFVDGPTGPADKQLNRTDICPQKDNTDCRVQTALSS